MSTTKRSYCLIFAICISSIFSGEAIAQQNTGTKLPLVTLESRLPASAEEGRKAIDSEAFGVVSIHERALALPVVVEESEDERLSTHSDVYEYFFIPITVGVAGLDGKQVKSFVVELSLPDRRVVDNDAWLIDVFPKLETAAGRLTAETEIQISGDLSVDATTPAAPIAAAAAAAKVSGKSRLNWAYNPVFQSFTAVYSEATAMWLFDKVADELKAGPIELRLLLAVRKDGRVAAEKRLKLNSHIRAEFSGGSLFGGRIASTSSSIVVEF